MIRRLPPLTAVRAFEAAARRLSFARAAEELNVTPAAISHQVKGLEEWLGVRLFQRHNGTLRLTPTGTGYLNGVSESFDKLWDVTDQLAIHDSRQTLSVVVPPTVASRWLVPRLHRYQALRPELELRITVVTPPIDFSQYNLDIGVAFGWEVPPNLQRCPWLTYEVIAVCSPKLLEGPVPLRSPQDLRNHRLLHDEALKIHDRLDWRGWLETLSVTDVDTNSGIRFSQATHGYQMAVDGQGVALGKSALVAGDIAEGRLIKLFDHGVQTDLIYELVYSETMAVNPKGIHFRDWMLDEAKRDRALIGCEAQTKITKRAATV